MRIRNKSQSFLEYAVLIGLAAAALVAMRVYLLRAVQERFRQSAEVFGQGEQYVKDTAIDYSGESPLVTLPPTVEAPKNNCPYVRGLAGSLRKELFGYEIDDPDRPGEKIHFSGLLEQQAKLYENALGQERSAEQLRLGLEELPAGNPLRQQAIDLRQQAIAEADELNQQAADKIEEAEELEAEAEALNGEEREEALEEAADLRREAETLRQQAMEIARQKNKQADELDRKVETAPAQTTADTSSSQSQASSAVDGLLASAAELRRQAKAKGELARLKMEKIDELVDEYGQCLMSKSG